MHLFWVFLFYFCEKFKPNHIDPISCEIDLGGVLTTFYKVICTLVGSKTCTTKFCTTELWRWFLVPTNSSPLALQNGTFHFRRKCSNHQHAFLCKKRNFASRSESHGILFWGNDLKSILIVKNAFQQYIICLCVKSFAKNHIFWDRLWNWQLKFASFWVQGQLGLRIKIRDHFKTYFDATISMAISELTNELLLKIVFFEISIIVSIYVKF